MKRIVLASAIVSALAFSHQAAAADCSTLAEWKSNVAYTGGSEITRNQHAYRANWWTQGDQPENNAGQWQVWTDLGACSGANFAPEVAITSPANNAVLTVQDAVTFVAKASDKDGQVTQVEFLLNGQSLEVVTAAPYQVNWLAALGQYTLTAIATDDKGAISESKVSFLVKEAGAGIAPSVNLTSPQAGQSAQVGELVTLSADASDQDGLVSQVSFYVNETLVSTDTSAPYSATWTATAGKAQIRAEALDDDNLAGKSQVVTLEVQNAGSGGCAGVPAYVPGNTYNAGDEVAHLEQKYRCDVAGWCSSDSLWAYEPGKGAHWQDAWTGLGICAAKPVVTISAPAQDAVLLAGGMQTITATATDEDGTIAKVDFYLGQTLLGTVNKAPYQLDWTAVALGEQVIRVAATDNEGLVGESSVRVSVSDQPIVAQLTAPESGRTLGLGKATKISANATSLVSDVAQVDFLVNGQIVGSDKTAPYSVSWTPAAIGQATIVANAVDAAGNSAQSAGHTVNVVEYAQKRHKLIGYWHNFNNPSGCPFPLSEMSDDWDIIDIAFADNDRNSNGTVHFNLYSGDMHSSCAAIDPVKFKQDMAAWQAKGKVFVLSLGGAEGTITLNTDQDEVNFVNSLTAIIQEWGFDGLDVDLESGSNLLHGTQIQARLGRALKQIEANIGGDMYLTMAPEHPYVQGGMISYSGIWGAYIPVINEVRDTLDLLHVQLYNNGGLHNPYMQGSAPEGSVDMMVAASRMLTEGFELADGSYFAPLRDDQVAIGLPSGPSSANSGQAPIQNIIDALDCLSLGTKCGTIAPTKLSPNFGGVMTWSINWDRYDGFNFSVPVAQKLDEMNQR
ncbi:hypothetical protein VST7929_00742 [Vibrio stylophorae]|uniref:chitinase n=1 Tax=Vibrio stylophorae TaxID=659351 RepID=A0ABM8ZRH1_9VIBR|nr:Ig-like domain-containing protein [Vibrio stylophorae]CAH0532895.1 hypothetical protein VST7929_00742 [Vibrio stylophorae]